MAVMAEVPVVIVNVMRGGPSTGMPTKPAQADMMQARWGTHGDHPIIALYPAFSDEIFSETVRAFNLAEKYWNPVILLLDEVLGKAHMDVEIPEPGSYEVLLGKDPRDQGPEHLRPQDRREPAAHRFLPRLPDPYRQPGARRPRLALVRRQDGRQDAEAAHAEDLPEPGRHHQATRNISWTTPRSWSSASASRPARALAAVKTGPRAGHQGRAVPGPDHLAFPARRPAGAVQEDQEGPDRGDEHGADEVRGRARRPRRRGEADAAARQRHALLPRRGPGRHQGVLPNERLRKIHPLPHVSHPLVPRLRRRRHPEIHRHGLRRAEARPRRHRGGGRHRLLRPHAHLLQHQHPAHHPRPRPDLRHRHQAGQAGEAGGGHLRRRRRHGHRRQPPDPRRPAQHRHQDDPDQQRHLRHDRRPGLAADAAQVLHRDHALRQHRAAFQRAQAADRGRGHVRGPRDRQPPDAAEAGDQEILPAQGLFGGRGDEQLPRQPGPAQQDEEPAGDDQVHPTTSP